MIDSTQQTRGFFAKPQDGIELVTKTMIMLVASFLSIIAYFIVFSRSIGSNVSQYVNQGDFVNMTSFAFVFTTLCVSFFWLNIGKERIFLLLALGFLVILMVLVISINRYLAVYPESNAFHLYFYVGILDFLTAITLPIGLGFVVARIHKKQTYD